MKQDDLIASVMGVLKVGKENAISFKELANKLIEDFVKGI